MVWTLVERVFVLVLFASTAPTHALASRTPSNSRRSNVQRRKPQRNRRSNTRSSTKPRPSSTQMYNSGTDRSGPTQYGGMYNSGTNRSGPKQYGGLGSAVASERRQVEMSTSQDDLTHLVSAVEGATVSVAMWVSGAALTFRDKVEEKMRKYSKKLADKGNDLKRRRSERESITTAFHRGIPLHHAAYLTFSLERIGKMTTIAFLAAEILAYIGAFGEEYRGTSLIHTTVERLKIRQRYTLWKGKYDQWYKEAKGPRGILNKDYVEKKWKSTLDNGGQNIWGSLTEKCRRLPDKTKFTIGAAIGLTSSRLLVLLAAKGAKYIGVSYILLEVAYAIGIIGDQDSGLGKIVADHSGNLQRVRDALEQCRWWIRRRLSPRAVVDAVEDFIESEGAASGGLAAGSFVGFLI